MSLSEWLAALRDLHERARRGQLPPPELSVYRARREELIRALLAGQRLTMRPGETPRRALRITRALQVEVDFAGSRERTLTLDVSAGGFSALLAGAPSLGDDVEFSLRIPAAEPLAGRARLIDVRPAGVKARAAFAFQALPDADRERIEAFVLDSVLAQLV